MSKLVVLASNNTGKITEFNALFKDKLQFISQKRYGVSPATEDGQTFVENAIKKARHAAIETDMPAVADDSGIVVYSLGGKPGVHSARFAGWQCDDRANNMKLLSDLKYYPDRRAYFVCSIVYLDYPADPHPIIATATWSGTIAEEPKGDNGFGYDCIFIPNGSNKTVAELSPQEKNRLSHRARASLLFYKLYLNRYGDN